MIAPPSSSLRVVRYAEGFGYSAQQWEAALAPIDWFAGPEHEQPQPLKHGRKGSVWRATLRLGPAKTARTIDCVLKVEPLATAWKRAKALIRQTKAHRQWRGATRLRQAGAQSSQPLAVLRNHAAEILVLEYLDAPTALEYLRDIVGQPSRERELADALARHHAALWQHDAAHADAKPSNFLVRRDNSGVRVVAIDTLDITKPSRRPRGNWQPDADDTQALLDLYLEPAGCGIELRATLCLRAMRAIAQTEPARAKWGIGDRDLWRQSRNNVWHELAAAITAHGDPTPADNPLEQPDLPPRSPLPPVPPRS